MEEEKCIQVLVGKSEGKRPFGRSTCEWEGNKMFLEEKGWKGLHWIGRAGDWLFYHGDEQSSSMKYC
jgi:hypothetical protein